MQDVHKKRGLGGRGWLIEEMLNIKIVIMNEGT